MSFRIKLLFSFLYCVSFLKAQINPPQGGVLNYTQVMFEYEKVAGADEYILQVAYDTAAAFDNLIAVQKDNSTATLISNLSFGSKYIWRYAGIKSSKQLSWNGPFKFEITDNAAFNLKFFQCRVLKNDSTKNAQGLLAIDFTKLVIDRKGNPVWYLPGLNTKFTNTSGACDLRVTTGGTFLVRANNTAYECDINGNVLWKASNNGKISKDTTEYYHHDFRKLRNGNYMILGEKYEWRDIPRDIDNGKFKPENVDLTHDVPRVKILFSTIIEYDKQGHIVWSWNSADYFSDRDIFAKETATNNPRRDLPANAEIFGHMNAFDVDSSCKFVYAGFRDISRIVKIERLTGKVVDSWGVKLPSGEARQGNDFFRNQHDVSIMPNNDLVVFNNNGLREMNNTSTVVEFSQAKENHLSKITWTFDCKFDSLTNGKSGRNGGVDYLDNDNMLICMGALSRVTEVTRSKKEIVWDAFFESRGTEQAPWIPIPLYRTHYISSLYPCYFTVQSAKDAIAASAPSFNITIYNEGSNADTYDIKLSSVSTVTKYLKSGLILPGKSKTIKISFDKLSPKTENVIAMISSKTNPDLIRQLKLKVIK